MHTSSSCLAAALLLLGCAGSTTPATTAASTTDGAVDAALDADASGASDAAAPDISDAAPDASHATDATVTGDAGGATRVIGYDGIARWDALASAERAKVGVFRSAFLHKSVGQDLEDGINANGFATDYITSDATITAPGISGGLFTTNNGDGVGKIAEWRGMALRNGSTRLRVAIMKFGYAEVTGDLAPIEAAYASAVQAVQAAGMRVVHVTPPLIFNDPADDAFKMQLRTWMLGAFPNDVIFDLMDVESTDPTTGRRCERGGSWEICDNVRSTSTCASLGQGVDAPSGQGHLCATQAERIAKAFLMAIYEAGR